MNSRIITTPEDFKSLRDDWNALLKASSNDVAHLTHEWMTAWWDSFGAKARPHIVVVTDAGGDTIGIAPLLSVTERYRGIEVKKLSLMVNGHSPSGDIIARRGCTEDVASEVIRAVYEEPGWDVLELNKIDCGGLTYDALLNAITAASLHFGIKDNLVTPYVPIDGTWDDFFKGRGKRFKKSMRNKINRIKKAGDVCIETVPLTSSSNGVFADMLKISGESWKHRIRADMGANKSYLGFYKEITELLGGDGLLNVWLLKKAGEPVAFELHINYRDIVYPIRADYSRAFKDLSPGSVLEYNILKSLFNGSSVKEYNTCGHNYHYLMNWTSRTRKYRNIEVFGKGLKPYLVYFLEYGLIPVARKFKPAFLNDLKRLHNEKVK